MKKFFLIFLLVWLPFQYSWSIAATYCQHEQEQTTHFGHHEHHHTEKETQKNDGKGGASKLTVHADCLNCHGGTLGIALSLSTLKPDATVTLANLHTSVLIQSPSLTRPERPKWVLAV